MSSEAASELAKARWRRATKAQRKAVGQQLKDSKTPEQRRAIAKKAAQARWSKKKPKG